MIWNNSFRHYLGQFISVLSSIEEQQLRTRAEFLTCCALLRMVAALNGLDVKKSTKSTRDESELAVLPVHLSDAKALPRKQKKKSAKKSQYPLYQGEFSFDRVNISSLQSNTD